MSCRGEDPSLAPKSPWAPERTHEHGTRDRTDTPETADPKRVAVVTGGSRGLGRRLCGVCACAGCDVLFTCCSRQGKRLCRLQPSLMVPAMLPVQADVRDAAAAREVIQTAMRSWADCMCWSIMPALRATER